MGWGAGVWTPAFAGERAPVPRVSARNRFAIPAVCLCRDRERLDFAGQILGARLGPAELARAGARQGARRDQFDQAVHAGDRAAPVAARLAPRPAPRGLAGGARADPT